VPSSEAPTDGPTNGHLSSAASDPVDTAVGGATHHPGPAKPGDLEEQAVVVDRGLAELDHELDDHDRRLEKIRRDQVQVREELEQVTKATETHRAGSDSLAATRKQIEMAQAETELARVKAELAGAKKDLAQAERFQAKAEGRTGAAGILTSVRASVGNGVKSSKVRLAAIITLVSATSVETALFFGDPKNAVAHAGAVGVTGSLAAGLTFVHRFYGQQGRLKLAGQKESDRTTVTQRMTELYDEVDFDFRNDRYKGKVRRSVSP
jgi:hypothetical protein